MSGAFKKVGNLKVAALYLVIISVAAFLLFYNLGDRLLWGDEAETANLAVNITKFGIPKTFDGKNTLTLFGSSVDGNGNGVWVWSPWLKEYLAAASFKLFGVSTTTARLPFAIAALAAVAWLMFVAYRLYRDHRVSLISAALLLSCDLFLLHARQCRYYSLIILAQILLIYGVSLLVTGKKWGPSCVVLALVMQFYSNYIVVGGNVMALLLFIPMVCLRRRTVIRGLPYGIVSFTALVAPWLMYAQPWRQTKAMGKEAVSDKLLYYLSELNFHVAPLAMLLLALALFVMSRVEQKRRDVSAPREQDTEGQEIESFLWILLPCHLFFVSLAPGEYLRYLLPLIPVLFLLIAAITVRVRKPYLRLVVYMLLVIIGLSNGVSIVSAFPFRGEHRLSFPLVNMVREITTPYEDRLKDVVTFLHQNAKPEQSLLVLDPEFPLIFYTGMKVIDARLDKDPLRGGLPNWILSQSASGVVEGPVIVLPQDLAGRYEKMVLRVHDSMRGGGIPEPDSHESFTAPSFAELVLYRRVP